jgi:hypothetical protein
LEKCSQTYGGDKPLNEPETKAIVSFIQQITKSQKLVGMIDFHSFSQLILYPPGYEGSTSVPTESALKAAASLHLYLLNTSSKILSNLEAIRVAVSDPVKIFTVIGDYSQNMSEFGKTVTSLNALLKQKTIINIR